MSACQLLLLDACFAWLLVLTVWLISQSPTTYALIQNLNQLIDYQLGMQSHRLPRCYQGGGESEWGERLIASQWTPRCQSVLEFGGGAGSVSTVIQNKLSTKLIMW